MLAVLPEIIIAGVLIYSMLTIKSTIDGIKGHDFYANEQLVFWHAFLFSVYCVLWII